MLHVVSLNYMKLTLKPIFHCDVKPFVLGPSIGLDPQGHNASRWNIGDVWSPMREAGVGHVHFIFFVLISFVLGTQREPSFLWNMGFRVYLSHAKW